MIVQKSLKNGLRVAAEPMAHMESLSIGVWIHAGGRYENRANSGISHLLEHLLFKGTKTRDMKTIKQEIEGRGGSFNGFTSEEHTCYLVKVLAKDAALGLDILSDMVLNPRLDEDEIRKEKDVIIEEINMYKDIPSHYVHEILAEMMWPDQPLGMPLAGSGDSVRSISRDALVLYRDEYYNPKNMLVVAAGQVREDDLLSLAEKYIAHSIPREVCTYKGVSLSQRSPSLKINSKDTEQTHIALGIHATDKYHPDKYALSLLNILMGANMSSRLFHIVRDEMALCYEISSSVRRYEDCGAFVVSAGVDHKKMVKSIEVILREIGRIKREPVTADELRRAKEYYRGQLLFALEDTMSHMLWVGEKMISNEKDYDVSGVLKKIEAVTAEDVMKVSRDIFKDENINLAVIGPVKGDKEVREVLHIR